MSNQVVEALERAGKQIVHALGEGASKAEHRLLHETADNLETAAKKHVEHDAKAAKDLETAARRRGDEHVTESTASPPTAPHRAEDGPGRSAIPTVSREPGGGPQGLPGHQDAQGRWRGSDGRFSTTPGKTDDRIDQVRRGSPASRDLSPDSRGPFNDTLAARTQAATSKAVARKEIDALAKKYDVDLSSLTSPKQDTWDTALRDLRRKGASRAEVNDAAASAGVHLTSDREMRRQSERLGMQAGEDVLRQDGYRQISGSSDRTGRPGEADLIGVSPDGTSIKVVEAKGGTATLGDGRYLGDHTPPGRAPQGSPAYLNDILKHDPGFQSALASNPALREAYQNGTLKIDYTLVSASPTGKVTETPLLLGGES